MPEELVLLVEKQLAMIVHDPAAHHTPTPSQLETWDASRRQDIAQQLARLEQRKAEDRASATATATATSAMTATPVPQDATLAATIQQKRAEREARRRQLATATATAAATSDAAAVSGATIRGSEERDDAIATAPASNNNAVYTVSVPTTSDTFAWYNSNNEHDDDSPQQGRTHTYETLDAARAAGVWNYPSSAEERARCEVFRDLWEKGYYMGGGSKFGGDWLVYPGARLDFSLSCS
jgi:tRNA-splicing endonuclease subunit Sen34